MASSERLPGRDIRLAHERRPEGRSPSLRHPLRPALPFLRLPGPRWHGRKLGLDRVLGRPR